MKMQSANRNRLSQEKSPYLLQHQHNPVDWYPWSKEAFDAAQKENKPIFLSIGYATCHWCHVMEKETFENQEAANYLNQTFICIKVDREERPDIDTLYMMACQILTGKGGWPLTILMTPKKEPFFAATYLPKDSHHYQMGVIELSRRINEIWQNQKEKIFQSAHNLTTALNQAFLFESSRNIDFTIADTTFRQLSQIYDNEFGGFKPPPKFPTPHRLNFLLRYFYETQNDHALSMVTQTLEKMRMGGIWDHVGYGFHRYSTDQKWLLPHFEKMLYDQALLSISYIDAFQITKNEWLKNVTQDIFEYVLRDMTASSGGFYSAEDADSEGEEGKFYIWDVAEFNTVLQSNDPKKWQEIFNLTPGGNFYDEATQKKNGTNILHLTQPWQTFPKQLHDDWQQVQKKLFDQRKKRIHPLKDDKILTDWNGLMIAALAYGGRAFSKNAYTDAAKKAVGFIRDHLKDEQGRLFHRYRDGQSAIEAGANDFAFLIFGLIELYRTTYDFCYLEEAVALQKQMMDNFWDKQTGGFYLTAHLSENLPVRPKEIYDGALPSANSVALSNLLVLSRLTGEHFWEDQAHNLVSAYMGSISAHPLAYTHFITGLMLMNASQKDVVVVAELDDPHTKNLIDNIQKLYLPNTNILLKTKANQDQLAQIAPFTATMQGISGHLTAYICKNHTCQQPLTDPEEILSAIKSS